MSAMSDLAAGRTVRYDNAPVIFSDHATAQANARCFRRLDLDEARRELHRLAAEHGTITEQPPARLFKARGRTRWWLVISEPLMAFPLTDNSGDGGVVATSCLTELETPVGAEVHWR